MPPSYSTSSAMSSNDQPLSGFAGSTVASRARALEILATWPSRGRPRRVSATGDESPAREFYIEALTIIMVRLSCCWCSAL